MPGETTPADPPSLEELLELEQELRERLTEKFREYEEFLQAINKTRFPEEKIFVLQVVLEIESGILPKRVVDSAWTWHEAKRPATNHPFVYFERVLRLQADRLNLPIPPFDYGIYSRIRPNQARLTDVENAASELDR